MSMKVGVMTSIALLAFATSVSAQDEARESSGRNEVGAQADTKGAPGAGAQAPADSGTQQLQEIIVTATKTKASARDIPVSLQAMHGDDLVQQGATTLKDILKNVAAVNITDQEVTIRGVGLTVLETNSQGHEAGFFLGESTMAPPSSGGANINFDPYDLDRVEVLEGPQSTLFGGTALSGAIRYIPNKPELGAFHGSLRTGYGDVSYAGHPLEDASAMVNVPGGDHFALRAAGIIRQNPDVGDNTSGNTNDPHLTKSELRQYRVMSRWEITDRMSAEVLYSHFANNANFALLDHPDSYSTAINNIPQPDIGRVDLGSLNLTYKFDAFSLVGVANALRNKRDSIIDGGPVIGVPGLAVSLPVANDADARVPSYELRIVSAHPSESSWVLFSNWDYIAGVYYMKANQHTDAFTDLGHLTPEQLATLQLVFPGIVSTGADVSDRVSEKALFFNLNRAVLEKRLEVNFGARLAETTLNAFIQQTLNGVPYANDTATDNGRRINPKVALTWHFSKDLNVRASMSEGFRFGGANSAGTLALEHLPPTFASDSLINYEAGLRSDWLKHTLRFDLTGYRIDWKNLQVTQLSPLASSYTANIGKAQIDGIEGQFTWRVPSDWPVVPKGLTLNSGVSWLNARTTVPFNSANGFVGPGTRLPLSPRTAATLGLSWRTTWQDWYINTAAQASYAGSRNNALIETYKFKPYTVVDASLCVSRPSWPGAPAVTLSGVNLTNQFILDFANPTTFNPQNFVFMAQGPRVIKLSLDLSF